MDKKKIADLLFPNLKWTTEEIEAKYPKRNLTSEQVVSRYAPSPTGYMHVGNFFQMFISYNLTRITDGRFFLRIEDTDSKREKKDATKVIYEILSKFGIKFNEYQTLDGEDIGDYGPYVQSQRVDIYKAYAKKLVAEGKAFPCFCKKTEGKEDILKLREQKFSVDDEKEYDPCRDLTLADVEAKLSEGLPFAIRLRTKNDGTQRVKFYDLIKGEIEAKANSKDFILLKNDGIPPYAFAHAVDDTLMGTTIVVRGEEYISSTPSHIELFEALGFDKITYCHNPLICKIGDQGNRRKISKRLDPEADMRYYFEEGYPLESVLEYLLNIINSGFEGWRSKNPTLPWQEFKFGVNDITTVAPIFDLVKLGDISKNIISKMTASQVYDNVLAWAEEYDNEFASYLKENKEFATKVFNIDRETPKPRKDIYCWKMVKSYFDYMFSSPSSSELSEEDTEKYQEFIKEYSKDFSLPETKEEWFANIKVVAEKLGYAVDNKLYKANPEAYKGNTAKACEFVRLALTGRKNSPDLYEIMSILGNDEITKRFSQV
ncbi:MAG: glutamate--tRNA ligase [Clostridia bacterium]|nr:glutamate--tRNA ligase [Clostridia bacterium]